MLKFDEKRVKTLSMSGMDRTVVNERTRQPIMLVLSVKITATFRADREPLAVTMVTYKKYTNGKVRANAATLRSSGLDRYVEYLVNEMLEAQADEELWSAVLRTRKLDRL